MASFVAKRAAKLVAEVGARGCSEQKAEKLGRITGVLVDRAVRKYKDNSELTNDYVQSCPTLLPDDLDGEEEAYKEYVPTLLPDDMRHYDSDGDEEVEMEGIDSEGHHKELACIQPFLKMAMEAYKDASMEDKFPFVERSQLIRDLKESTKLKWGITTDTEVHVCVLEDGTLAFVFRGTELMDWKCPLGDILTDLELNQCPMEHYDASKNVSYKAHSSVKVHKGFQLAFQDVTKTHRRNENLCLVAEGLGVEEETLKRVVCIGHSLGGALATLCAHWCRYIAYPKAQIWCVTIGSPRVGNRAFANDFNANVTKGWSYRVVNKGDVVPSIPHLYTYPKICSAYKHVEGLMYLSEHPTSKDTIFLKRGGRRPSLVRLSFKNHSSNAYITSIDKVLATFYEYGSPRITLPSPALN